MIKFKKGNQLNVTFLFPGQGAQYPGMCKSILLDFPYVKKYFEEANDILGFDVLDLCHNGPIEKLNLTENTQPALFVTSYSTFKIIQKELNLSPFLLAGHSLGEISALCCSGAIKFNDAIKITRKRGKIMQATSVLNQGAMIAVNNVNKEKVEALLKQTVLDNRVVISNINSKFQLVLSGEKNAVEKFGLLAKTNGGVVIPLKVSAAFHSPMMQSAAKEFEKELNNFQFGKLKFPVLSSAKNKPYISEFEIVPLLVQQMTKPVNWLAMTEYIRKTSTDYTLEIGPGKTLSRFAKDYENNIPHYHFKSLIVNQKGLLTKI